MDAVHEWVVYRREVTRTPFRALAAEIGIPKSTVQKFYKEKFRPAKVWPKLRDWYMKDRQSRHTDYRTPPEDMVMSAMRSLEDIPQGWREQGVRDLVETYQRICARAGIPCPEWVEMLATHAKEQEGAVGLRTGRNASDLDH